MPKKMITRLPWMAVLFLWLSAAPVWAKTYHLHIRREQVDITGAALEKITINHQLPGPTLRFVEGEEAIIHVTNHMKADSSIHWHGLLLPGAMDGVPGFNGFPGIPPGETFTYRFRIRQSGTYWYHAHSLGQEQEGQYGSIVITPKRRDSIRADRDYVVLISDFHAEDSGEIHANLKKSSEYYQRADETVGDFFKLVGRSGFTAAVKSKLDWGEMRMARTDLSDVTGYVFLINGKPPQKNWTGLFKPGERIRLRFINASAMSIYDVRIAGLKMQVVAADGQDVAPVMVDEFRFGVAETYDVIVTPKADRAYTIAAESIDRAGFALGTLAPRPGMKGAPPKPRKRALLSMADMAHAMDDHAAMGHDMSNMAAMGHEGHDMSNMAAMMRMKSGWADAATPSGHKALSYADLRYRGRQRKSQPPQREIRIKLGGNMERYIWTINDQQTAEAKPIELKYGERVRLTFANETMMAHPMHLHGMFVQLENGQANTALPNKHTVIVPPGDSLSVLLTADELGEWALHCHLLYHMMSGMMSKVVVAQVVPEPWTPIDAGKHGGSIFYRLTSDIKAGFNVESEAAAIDWDVDGWIGGDDNKFWFKSEGEADDDHVEQAELWLMLSRNIAVFWDIQMGFRGDAEPGRTAYGVIGFHGLAPYFFETEAHLFVSHKGDVSARLHVENELLLTQQLRLLPYLELNLFAQDVPEQDVGAGLAEGEIGLEVQYVFTPKFGAYIDIHYARAFGETASIARRAGESENNVVFSLGTRFMF